MENTLTKPKDNKLGAGNIKKIIWTIGLPMIVSMILQAVYNIVDTIFVVNMGEDGVIANLALTYSFPIQIFMIAVGVGTGIGVHTLLSRYLGEKNTAALNKTIGTSIVMVVILFIVFLVFGLFCSRPFMKLMTSDEQVIEMGTTYLTICCSFAIGNLAFNVFERFLQSSGKSIQSAICQIAGAVTNIVLDYVFIYPCKMGIAGAAWATIIGQLLCCALAIIFHLIYNKDMKPKIKDFIPSWKCIKDIYKIGLSGGVLQALLSIMMLSVNAVLGTSASAELLTGSFGIYYKIMNLAIMAFFGLNNAAITIISFNYGLKDKNRVKTTVKWVIIDAIIVALVITALYEIFADQLAQLFGLTATGSESGLIQVVSNAVRICASAYILMGFNMAIIGILQSFRKALSPLLIGFCKFILFVIPTMYLLIQTSQPEIFMWLTFVICEVLTLLVSVPILIWVNRKIIRPMSDKEDIESNNIVITINRVHGSNGRYIASRVAENLNIPYFDKFIAREVAKETNLDVNYLRNENEDQANYIYLTTETNNKAIIGQIKVIRQIALNNEKSIIVGRAANFITRDFKYHLSIFINADEEFRINSINKYYGDDRQEAKHRIMTSDQTRSKYYHFISGLKWKDESSYDLYVTNTDDELTISMLTDYIQKWMESLHLSNQ